ncbi:MAG TPA: heme-binding protein [Terriglobia bacterium]|nr:heme-binding protein [Terriglobia bacterium]
MNHEITLEVAEKMIHVAKSKAEELKILEDIAVVDASGNLKAFVRMDGAWLGSIDIAIRKARTARYFDMETDEIGKMSQPGQPLYGVEHSNGGLITFGGGIPLKDTDGTVIGAVGVSGSSVDNDVKVAKAAVEACNSRKSATA